MYNSKIFASSAHLYFAVIFELRPHLVQQLNIAESMRRNHLAKQGAVVPRHVAVEMERVVVLQADLRNQVKATLRKTVFNRTV